MHTFVYEIEYKADYMICHRLYKSEIMVDDWHDAMGFIQKNMHRLIGANQTVIKITLIKEY
jgi:hypothetical protein